MYIDMCEKETADEYTKNYEIEIKTANLIERVEKINKEALEIMLNKNKDYGAKIDNIALTGIVGIAVRLIDKVSRVYSLTAKDPDVKDESMRDTLLDIINYANIGVQLIDGVWK